jgi:hypothetical protein
VAVAAAAAAGAAHVAGATPTSSTSTTTAATTPSPVAGGSFGSGTFIAEAGGSGALTLQRLGMRSAPGGVGLRVYLQQLPSATSGGGIPLPCLPNVEVMVEVSSRDVAAGVVFGMRSGQMLSPVGQLVGQREGQPIAVVAAQVPAGTRAAVMHFSKGHTDTARPLSNGLVVLASTVAIPLRTAPLLSDTSMLGELRVIDQQGRQRSLGEVGSGLGSLVPGCGFPPSVSVPTTTTTLPSPTGPPPTNAGAARAAVEAAYRAVFNGTVNSSQVSQNLEGGAPPLTPAARAQLQQEYGDVLGHLTVRVNNFQFLNATTAVLSFDLLSNGQPITATSTGEAVLEDGHWKVTRASLCSVISRAGIPCS